MASRDGRKCWSAFKRFVRLIHAKTSSQNANNMAEKTISVGVEY